METFITTAMIIVTSVVTLLGIMAIVAMVRSR